MPELCVYADSGYLLKRIRYIGLLLLLLLSQMTGAVNLTSSDPCWMGGSASFSTTGGNDFWVTFMTNSSKGSDDPTLNFTIYAVAEEAMIIIVADASDNQLGTIDIPAGGGMGTLDKLAASSVYLQADESETIKPRGVHIYTEDKNARFYCAAIAAAGSGEGTTSDASLLIPTNRLAKEYFIQTYPDNSNSTEFAVVATEDGTKVTINTSVETFKHTSSPIQITLNKGDVYMVRSASKSSTVPSTDLSGSTVCADKPVAVFQGNDAARVASGFVGGLSANHIFEQASPSETWGTEFHFGLTAHAKRNFFHITAAYDGTSVTIKRKGMAAVTVDLDAGQSLDQALFVSDTYSDATIISNQPILCYSYLSCGERNTEEYIDPISGEETIYSWGNPTNGMVPAWSMRTTDITFFADTIAKEEADSKCHMYVQVITKDSEKNLIQLDGVGQGATFTTMVSDPTMAVANIELTDVGLHHLTTTGSGFVGFVYTITSESRAFQYTLGYNPMPERDSMFVSNANVVNMSEMSYDLPKLPQGWYQRQWEEWKDGCQRLDTAQVCDKSTVEWTIQAPASDPIKDIKWFVYDVTGGVTPATPISGWPKTTSHTGNNYTASQLFALDPELDKDPKDRTPFKEYEIHALLYREHEICTTLEDDIDTMRTTVRVSRTYHDTIYRTICMGDTIKCFYDSLPHQGGQELIDQPAIRNHSKADSTMFIGDKTLGNTYKNWEWKAREGQNIFTRKYESIYGCDSTYTIYLFVCDTFRQVDPCSLVSNGAYEYHGERYVGHEYHEQTGDIRPDDHVIPDGTLDTIVYVKFKTTICGCQSNPKYTDFEGCDSVYELHIKYHNTFFQSDTITICDNERDKLQPLGRTNEFWYAGYKFTGVTQPTDSILKQHETISYDSLKTVTLPKRDSVYERVAYMNPSYEYYDTLYVCDNKSVTWNVDPALTYNGADYKDDYEHTDTWVGHTKNCGCDSVRHLKIWVYKTFFQHEDSMFCQDPKSTGFVWKGHENRWLYDKINNKKIHTSAINLKQPGEFIYVDSLINQDCQKCGFVHGCDSVYELRLTINPTYAHLQVEEDTICQNEEYTWIRNGVTYKNLTPQAEPYIFTKPGFTDVYGCDSTWTLKLTVRPSYLTPVEITKRYMCDTDTMHFYDKVYRGEKSTYTASDAITITIPSNKSFTHEETPIHTDQTTLGCDSAVQHSIYVYKTYETLEEDHVCQGESYIWQGGQIDTHLKSGEVYTFTKKLKTKDCPVCDENGKCGCDSTIILKLRIDSVYTYTHDTVISNEQSYKWQHKIYVGDKVNKDTLAASWFEPEWTDLGNKPEIIELTGSQTKHHFTAPYSSVLGCDSTYHLDLIVAPTFRDTISATTCDNTPYKWHHDNDPDESHYARTDIEILTPGTYYDSLKTSFNFDSIYVLHLSNYPTFNKDTTKDTIICQNEPFIWKRHEGHTLWDKQNGKRITTIPTDQSGTFYYIDSTYKTIHGCDSVWTLKLIVPPSYNYEPDKIHICAYDTISWQGMLLVGSQFEAYGGTYNPAKYDSVLIGYHGFHTRTIRRGTKKYDCDSIFHLELTVDSLYRKDTLVRQCQDTIDGKFFYRYLNNGVGGNLPAQWLHQSLTRNDTVRRVNGCDSLIVTLTFYVDSVYHYHQDLGFVCQDTKNPKMEWIDKFGKSHGFIDISKARDIDSTEYNTVKRYASHCDSNYTFHLHVAPTYYIPETRTLCESDTMSWEGMLLVGSEFGAYGGTYDPTKYDSILGPVSAGTYERTIRRGTKTYDCDSIYHLTLNVSPIYRVTDIRRTCQSVGGTYYYDNADIYLPAEHLSDSLQRTDTLPAVNGCDSIVGLIFYVDSVYHYHRDLGKVCQDTVNTTIEMIDKFGKSHGLIDISRARDITDTLVHYTTIHECDSDYTFSVHIAPIYRFDSVYSICDNERIYWQHKWYCGDKYKTPQPGDIILKPGCRATQDTIYCDTVRYQTTIEGCDSTYLLQLHVYPSFNDTVPVHVCDNEDKHDYTFSDTHGKVFKHHIPFAPTPSTEFVTKPDIDTLITDTLHTIHGCDSLVTLHLTIHPTYFFAAEEKVCFGVERTWHGKVINASGIYYDSCKTAIWECDSIYKLEFYVKPYLTVPIFDNVCDNHVYYHRDTIYGPNGEMSVIEDTVWHPGSPIPDPVKRPYIEVKYFGADGCDSIAFQYHLTVCKTYSFTGEPTTICSGDTIYSKELNHAWSDWAIEYDVDTFVVPYDTLFIDSLQTFMGCDSVYNVQAHVFPAYRHIDKDTICGNDSLTWRDRLIKDLKPGLHFIRDSFETADKCDSIYELQLMVHADFFNEEHITLCADDSIDWHGWHIAHLIPQEEEYFFPDSQLTVLTGCDSVYHLYVTALDTTMEVHYDTICYNDTLHVLNHLYTIAGDYKDTTLNDDGCHHFIYTHLAVIPPTVPTVWADSMCDQKRAFEFYYTYTSHEPLAYSLYFDSLALAMGFEDIIDEPVTEYTNPMVITVPIPWRDDDSTKYPRPDIYGFRLVLDNGFCQRPLEDCVNDSTFVMSYPYWLIEQHYNDVIALLDSAYNGGYSFSEYQWYQGDSMLVGQTKPYLHIPTGLELGASYFVRLRRNGDEMDFQTCPITIESYVKDPYAPTMGYISVTPTCVTTGHPFVNILSHSPNTDASGVYRVSTTDGNLVAEGSFHADVTPVELPNVEGMYIFQLWSPDTPEEPYRAIKVIVRQLCPNCDISSF